MTAPSINDFTPSDAGPWKQTGCGCCAGCASRHVIPLFEQRGHVPHPDCPCHPITILDEDGVYVMMHNVAQ